MDFTPSGQEGIEKFVPKMKDISRLTHIKSDEELLNDWKRLPEATKNKLIPNWKNMMIFQILKELKKL